MNLLRGVGILLPKLFVSPLQKLTVENTRLFSIFTPIVDNLASTTSNNIGPCNRLLVPESSTIVQKCGMKVKGKPKLRCKDCYFVRRDERLYVMCPSNGKHKAMSMVTKPHNTWILTHATQSKYRPW